ncbi:hypothetical protein [Microbacterium immunditiarum]|uniref:Uncharacterized protein n=1 Tax=Microbacterium immunditiarum TaxID=337480 RepID=A0A7Y9GQH1_9MICO|nr:hypothetical protein [Microbacterium immunditiarum]NYE20591.1 hypothetical protein [Microbacterium immunditiarum]
MSTPEQPDTPALTRKQLREIRTTGATPVVDAAAAPAPAAPTPPVTSAPIARPDYSTPAPSAPAPSAPAFSAPVFSAPAPSAPVFSAPAPSAPAAPPVASTPAVPLARPAEPPALPPPPVADSAVDLGVAPLTRRQARQQERIRTASVPVITPEVASAFTSAATDAPAVANTDAPPAPAAWQTPVAEPPARVWPVPRTQEPRTPLFGAPAPAPEPRTPLFGAPAPAPEPEPPAPQTEPPQETGESGVPTWLLSAAGVTQEREAEQPPPPAASWRESAPYASPKVESEPERAADRSHAPGTGERGAVSSHLGAGLLAEGAPNVVLPPSFDELITSASTSGSTGTPNALIVPQPDQSGIVAPVAATGEVLVTGTFNLPEGLGSTGAIPGTADGKEVDAVLVDGELPAHSSPTPIAASAAISTVKTPGEIIKPPTPEKGSRLMISLAITAGALALALVGVLILAFVTGVL